MTTKCWFVLRQTHYPPPDLPEFGVGAANGPICLGHVIPDLKDLDNVINTKGPQAFPSDMPIYPSTAWDLTWQTTGTVGDGLDGTISAPFAVAAGLELNLSAGIAFQKSVHQSDQFERLETFIIQPTAEYVEDTVEDPQVLQYVRDHTTLGITKSMFLITGMIIARGAKTSREESNTQSIHGGPGIGFASIAEATLDATVNHETAASTVAARRSDFVWAIRLAKLSKGILDREWSHSTFAKGASFGVHEDEDLGHALIEALYKEGMQGFGKIRLGNDVDHVFLIQSDT